ncbi:MAG: carbonic anhydrase, partial [Proteobacteria bacterium]|nr:carbonic anhydrase [Pseudomonadota bacterium]
EFAVSTFATILVLVMGHSQCGAITATLKHIDSQHMHASENIQDIISRIKPHVFPIAQVAGLSFEEKLTRSVEANILASVEKLKSSSQLIEGLVYHKKLAILGAVLDLETGSVKLLDI